MFDRDTEGITHMVRCGGRGYLEWFAEGHDQRSSSGSADSNTGGDLL